MEKKDFLILAELRKNSRAQYSEVSRKLKIPISTVCELAAKLAKLRTDVAMLNFAAIGYPIRIFIALAARKGKKNDLRSMIEQNKSVNTASSLQGEYDFFIDAIFRDFDAMQQFLELIEKFVKRKAIFYVISIPKLEEMQVDL